MEHSGLRLVHSNALSPIRLPTVLLRMAPAHWADKVALCHCARDSVGHILGSCLALSKYHISRHNKAVCFMQNAILSGSLGQYYTVMDATARSSLPAGVADTRLPRWILPHLPPSQISLFRPDILIIEGLIADQVSNLRLSDPMVLHHLQSHCRIHVLEVGYTSDASLVTSLSRKHFQHVRPCHELMRAGWKMSLPGPVPYHIALLGMSGLIFKPFATTLTALGVGHTSALKLMRKLTIHAVHFAYSIIRLRRKLEFEPP